MKTKIENHNNQVPARIRQLIEKATFIALRYEADYTPCAGIATVVREERRIFARHGVVIAPWEPKMVEAQRALASGKVCFADSLGNIPIAYGVTKEIRIYLAEEANREAIIYLEVPGFFQGSKSPYDTPFLKQDTIVFAMAVVSLLDRIGTDTRQWLWCADWETIPALVLARKRYHVALHLHNVIGDNYLGDVAREFSFPVEPSFQNASVLQVGLRQADVVAAVSRGFAWSLQHEPIYTHVIAPHLQGALDRMVAIENANFTPLTPELIQIQSLLSTDPKKGRETLDALKSEARKELPAEIQKKLQGRSLIVVMGRRSSQKLHEVSVASAQIALRRSPDLPAFWFFTTLSGDGGSDARLEHIRTLCGQFPQNADFSDGRIDFFNELLAAADFNLMPSLYEPYGGCFQGSAVPIIRSIDGLAVQVPGYEPTGAAAKLHRMWHGGRPGAGWSVREDLNGSDNVAAAHLREIVETEFPVDNPTIRALNEIFARTVTRAVLNQAKEPEKFASLVLEGLRIQEARSWEFNYGGMLSNIAGGMMRRSLA